MKSNRKKKAAPKNPIAQAMAALRWKNTTAAERKQIAKKTAAARWNKKAPTEPPPSTNEAHAGSVQVASTPFAA